MYKLEIDCYGGIVTVETDFVYFAAAVGELIKKLQDKEVLGIPHKDIGNITATPDWMVKEAMENAPKKRGRPAGSTKKQPK